MISEFLVIESRHHLIDFKSILGHCNTVTTVPIPSLRNHLLDARFDAAPQLSDILFIGLLTAQRSLGPPFNCSSANSAMCSAFS